MPVTANNARQYQWTRYWVPRGAEIYNPHRGYAPNPEFDQSGIFTKGFASSAQLAEKPCLVLLGEAGSGKSTEIRSMCALIRDETTLLRLDLGGFGDEVSLTNHLIGHERIRDWRAGDYPMSLFLDGLDEAQIGFPKISNAIQRVLNGMPRERLLLRITCRTAAWPEALTGMLREVFKDVDIRELIWLNRDNVESAAQANDVDAREFLKQVEERDAVALAVNPVTLNLLIRQFAARNQLPASSVELYEKGLRSLCETCPDRRERGNARSWSPSQILRVAGRIAAMSILLRRPTIHTGTASEELPTDLSVADVAGGEEVVDGVRFELTREIVDAALIDSGIFGATGPRRFGFSHKTYAEFLAGRYLHETDLQWPQIRSLLFVPDADGDRVIPPLAETTAWLAAYNGELFGRLRTTEPEILLLSDVATKDASARENILDSIFDRIEGEKLTSDERLRLSSYCPRIRHPGIAAQLAARLEDPATAPAAREFAVLVARECGCVELADQLIATACNVHYDYSSRVTAVYALKALKVDGPSLTSLKPLALSPNDDPYDNLRAYSLRLLWPRYLSMNELVSSLSLPHNERHHGSFTTFIDHFLIPTDLSNEELVVALEWGATRPVSHDRHDPRLHLAGKFATFAVKRIDDQAVLDALARLVARRIDSYETPCFVSLEDQRLSPTEHSVPLDQADRRRILEAVLPLCKRGASHFFFSPYRFIVPDDFDWLLRNAASAKNKQEADRWARLSLFVFSAWSDEHLQLLNELRNNSLSIQEQYALNDPVEIGSERAKRMKADFYEMRAFEAEQLDRRQRRGLSGPTREERVRAVIEHCSQIAPEDFPSLLEALSLDERCYISPRIPSRLQDFEGWGALSAEQRREVLACARGFLTSRFFEREAPTGDTGYVIDLAPGFAVQVVRDEDPEHLGSLQPEIWKNLAPYLVHHPVYDSEKAGACAELAYKHATHEINNELRRGLLRQPGTFRALALIKNCADDEMVGFALDAAKSESCGAERFRQIIGWLISRRCTEAISCATSLLRKTEEDGSLPRLAMEAANVLADRAPGCGWREIWELIETDAYFGTHLIKRLAGRFGDDHSNFPKQLGDEQLGALLGWMFVEFPPKDDRPFVGGVQYPTVEDDARRLRDQVLRSLVGRGSAVACDHLRSLRDRYAEYPWLKEVVLEAERTRRNATWYPPTPTEFKALVRDASNRFVRSPCDLMQVLIESLGRLQKKLSGPNPARNDLWNFLPDKTGRPKDEADLADYIARFFRDDLKDKFVGAYREVEYRRRIFEDGEQGQRTDILVSGIAAAGGADPSEMIELIIEVKGQWHAEVRTAMKTQLLDRYLHSNHLECGLYVVGWYQCADWDSSDRRLKVRHWDSLDQARQQLQRQAHELSSANKLVREFILDCSLG